MRHNLRLRSTVGFILIPVIALFSAAGCGGDSGSDTDDGKVTLRFNWWGSDSRHTLTQQVIAQFQQKHPNITVQPEYSNFADYFDKLSTNAAAGDLPDVMQVTDPYMYSYIDNGQLLDLRKVEDALPTGDFAEASLSGTTVDDGLYGIPAGLSGFGLFADPTVFTEAGITIPDDTTWSWDEYVQVAAALSKAAPGIAGTQFPLDEQMMNVWLRQHNEDFWKPDGSDIAFTAPTAAAFWEFVRKLRDSGGTLTPEAAIEAATGGIEQSPLALHKGAMQLAAVPQLGALEKVSGREARVLLFPGEGQATATGMYSKPGIFYAVAAKSEHPKEAAMLIDYMVNSPEVAKLQKFDRGVPANPKVLQSILADLTPAERRITEYFDRVSKLNPRPFPRQHASAGAALPPAVARLTQDVLFDRTTPQKAAEQLISELKAEM